MAIIKLDPDLFEFNSVTYRPERQFVSNSNGSSGFIPMSSRQTSRIRSVEQSANFSSDHPFNDIVESLYSNASLKLGLTAPNLGPSSTIILDGTNSGGDMADRVPPLFHSIRDGHFAELAENIGVSIIKKRVFDHTIRLTTTFDANSDVAPINVPNILENSY